jgi:hypothetical protein
MSLVPGGGRHSVGYLSRLERGWSSPPLYTYIAIVEALEADPARVFGPDLVDVDPAEQMLLSCLKELGIAPHQALATLMSSSRPSIFTGSPPLNASATASVSPVT